MRVFESKEKAIVYAYTMTDDTGFAPCINNKILSLACCKTNLRYKIARDINSGNENIYLLGLCGKQMADRHKYISEYLPIYLAKITKSVTTEEYFGGEDFISRPDAKYLFDGQKWYVKSGNPHVPINTNKSELSNPEKNKDLYYFYRNSNKPKLNSVLISENFAYFGKHFNEPRDLPEVLKKICEIRKESVRGDLKPIYITTEEDKRDLLSFLNTNSCFNVQNESNTIDTYFVKKKCHKENKCR